VEKSCSDRHLAEIFQFKLLQLKKLVKLQFAKQNSLTFNNILLTFNYKSDGKIY